MSFQSFPTTFSGNMTDGYDFTNPSTPKSRHITYNADNMPVTIDYNSGQSVATIWYDGTGARAKKTVGSVISYYVGDHYEIIGGTIRRYIFAGNLRVAQVKGSTITYFHKDHLGSSTVMTNSSGNQVESTSYMPFGGVRDHTGTETSTYKFTDQELDAEYGLYNYGARLYDPIIGRFISADPIIPQPYNPQSLNRYSYCLNNPLIYVDPSGYENKKNEEGEIEYDEESNKYVWKLNEIVINGNEQDRQFYGPVCGPQAWDIVQIEEAKMLLEYYSLNPFPDGAPGVSGGSSGGNTEPDDQSNDDSNTDNENDNDTVSPDPSNSTIPAEKKGYLTRVWENFKTTNATIPGILAPPGLGIITGGATADAYGTTTLLSWASSGFRGATLSGASFTGLETGILVVATQVTNVLIVGSSWEVGVFIGSMINGLLSSDEEP